MLAEEGDNKGSYPLRGSRSRRGQKIVASATETFKTQCAKHWAAGNQRHLGNNSGW